MTSARTTRSSSRVDDDNPARHLYHRLEYRDHAAGEDDDRMILELH